MVYSRHYTVLSLQPPLRFYCRLKLEAEECVQSNRVFNKLSFPSNKIWNSLGFLFCLWCATASFALAESAPGDASREPASAVLMIHNRPIAIFRTPFLSTSPQTRARLAKERIDKVLDQKEIGKVTTKELPEGTAVLIGEHEVLLLLPGDVAGESREMVVERAVRNLRLAIEEVEEMRDPALILEAIGRTFLATIVFLLLLWADNRLFRASIPRLLKFLEKSKEKLAIRGFPVVEFIFSLAQLLLKAAAWIFAFFATYIWLSFSLRQFPYTRALGDRLRSHFFAALETVGLATLKAVPDLIVVLVIFVLTHLLARLIRALFEAVEQGQISFLDLDPYLAKPTRRIAVWALWIFAIIMAYPYIPGSDTMAFQGVSILVGVLVSLGSSSIVGQAMGGLVLTYSKAFKPGDFIHVGGMEATGTVSSLGVLSTRLRTAGREEISIPNVVLLTNMVTNYTQLAQSGLILIAKVTIGYDAPWRKVHKLLILAAERTPGVQKAPPPFVYQTSLSDFYIEYCLSAVTSNREKPEETLSALYANIQDLFNEHGEQIMSPHYMMDPPHKVWVPRDRWHEPPAEPDDEPGA